MGLVEKYDTAGGLFAPPMHPAGGFVGCNVVVQAERYGTADGLFALRIRPASEGINRL